MAAHRTCARLYDLDAAAELASWQDLEEAMRRALAGCRAVLTRLESRKPQHIGTDEPRDRRSIPRPGWAASISVWLTDHAGNVRDVNGEGLASDVLPLGSGLRRDLHIAGALMTVVLVAYLATITTSGVQVNDSRSAAIAAWNVAERDSWSFPGEWVPSIDYWAVRRHNGGYFSNRMPAVIVWGVPFYSAARLAGRGAPEVSHPWLVPFGPAGVAGATASALGVGAMFLVLRRIGSRRQALTGALLLGFATPVWSVAADALWPHSLTLGILAASMLASSCSSLAGCPLAASSAAASVLTRPHLAIAQVTLGVADLVSADHKRAFARFGGMVLGLLALAGYSRSVFGTWLPAAGYDGTALLDRLWTSSVTITVLEVFGGIFHPRRGILVVTPMIVILLVFIDKGWRASPVWVRGSSLSGLVYLLLQFRMARWSGGSSFAGYRTPLEAVYLTTPLFLVTYRVAVANRYGWRTTFWITTLVSFLITLSGAIDGGRSIGDEPWWEDQLQRLEDGYDPLIS
jgi:hypothetical protein